jgi:phosphoribosylglycinamide formyltransferase-1
MVVRLAVLVSGGGTNLQALLDDPVIRPAIALVVSDRPAVKALDRATDAGVATVVVEPVGDRDHLTHDVARVLAAHHIEAIASAGYMRVLGTEVVGAFRDRWLNVHPALLPSFPGMHAVRQALANGVKVTGVTVHLVDEGVDTGPIVLQEAVAVHDDDDWDSLEARIHEVEHRLLPRAVRALTEGTLRRSGRRAWIEGGAA